MLGSLRYGFWTDKFLSKFDREGYRHAFVAAQVKTWIARQIKLIREKQGMSQAALGKASGKPQSAIARLENPDYGQMSLQTLLEIAKAFDVGLVVKFTDHETFLNSYRDLGDSDLEADKYDPNRLRSRQLGNLSVRGVFSAADATFVSISAGTEQEAEVGRFDVVKKLELIELTTKPAYTPSNTSRAFMITNTSSH